MPYFEPCAWCVLAIRVGIKENRRLGTRFEKLAVNFLAMVRLAMIRRCLRLLLSSDSTSPVDHHQAHAGIQLSAEAA